MEMTLCQWNITLIGPTMLYHYTTDNEPTPDTGNHGLKLTITLNKRIEVTGQKTSEFSPNNGWRLDEIMQ